MEVREGRGWRLAHDPARAPFPVLLGGDGWAAELTLPEAEALRRGVRTLVEQHAALTPTLMAEEALTLQVELPLAAGESETGAAGVLWLELDGDREDWCLRLVLTPAGRIRGLEGSWGREASRALAAVLLQEEVPEER